MWKSILEFFNGLLDVTNAILSAWHDSQERQAGRNEVTLENYKQDLANLEKANEIDHRPLVSDRAELLNRLREKPAAQ